MRQHPSPARTRSLRRLADAIRHAARPQDRRRPRRDDDGTADAPVSPAPTPLPMTGGAEAPLD